MDRSVFLDSFLELKCSNRLTWGADNDMKEEAQLMKVAVTYENGNVFQHFGRTENFKIYEIENGVVGTSYIMNSNGVGHEALAGLLANGDIDVLICGGMGQGAKDALTEAGLEVYAGASGSADEAVQAFISGELVDSGVNCDHHEHDHAHSHGHDEAADSGCGGCSSVSGCSGCPGCGEPMLLIEGKNAGKTVSVHYRGFFDNGEQFDSSYDRNQPLEFVCGTGAMITGFDKAVLELEPGETIEVHLEPAEAYGEPNPQLVITVPKAGVEGSDEVEVGDKVMLQDELGRPFDAVVTASDAETVTFDCNHQMAGKALNFSIEMLSVN